MWLFRAHFSLKERSHKSHSNFLEGGEEKRGIGELEGGEENRQLFTDPKADMKHYTNLRCKKENGGYWVLVQGRMTACCTSTLKQTQNAAGSWCVMSV